MFNSVQTNNPAAGNVPVYSYSKPFNIYVHTDSVEGSSSPPESLNRSHIASHQSSKQDLFSEASVWILFSNPAPLHLVENIFDLLCFVSLFVRLLLLSKKDLERVNMIFVHFLVHKSYSTKSICGVGSWWGVQPCFEVKPVCYYEIMLSNSALHNLQQILWVMCYTYGPGTWFGSSVRKCTWPSQHHHESSPVFSLHLQHRCSAPI